jgi:hypothetical protein
VAGPLGPIKDAFLILQAPMCRIRFAELESSANSVEGAKTKKRLYTGPDGVCIESFNSRFDEVSPSHSWPGQRKDLHFCTFHEEQYVQKRFVAGRLILDRTKRAKGEYRRVGVLDVYEDDRTNSHKKSPNQLDQDPIGLDEYLESNGEDRYTIKIV